MRSLFAFILALSLGLAVMHPTAEAQAGAHGHGAEQLLAVDGTCESGDCGDSAHPGICSLLSAACVTALLRSVASAAPADLATRFSYWAGRGDAWPDAPAGTEPPPPRA